MREENFLTRRQCLGSVTGGLLLGVGVPSSAQDGVIRIGQVLPLSGPIAPATQPIVEGQTACLQEVNAQGGIHGRRIELIALDDGFDPKKTVALTHQLLEQDRVTALFGYGTGAGIGAVLPLLQERRIPMLALYTGIDQLRAKFHPYLFTTTASNSEELRQIIRNLVTLQSTRLGLVVPNTEIGKNVAIMIQAMAKEAVASVVAVKAGAVDGSDAAETAQFMATQDVNAVLLGAVGAQVLGFMQAASGQVRVPIYAISLAGTASFLKVLGPAARGLAISQIIPFPWRSTNTLARRFATAMNKAGMELSYDRMWGFLNASILVEVLRRAGKQPASESITAAIEGMTDVDIGGYRLNYSKTQHHGSRFVEMTMIGSRGEYVR